MILRYVAKIRNEMLWTERNVFQLLNHCVLFSPKWLGWQILSQNMGRGLATWPIINSIHQTFHDPESNIIECTIYHGTFKFPLMWNCFAQDMNIHVILKLIRVSSNIRFHLCMIFIACKPFLCEGSIYIGGLETLLQKQQKATAKFERTDGIVGGKEKADGTLTSTMAFMGLLAPHCCPTRQNLSCKWNSWKLQINAKQNFDKDLQTLK